VYVDTKREKNNNSAALYVVAAHTAANAVQHLQVNDNAQ
jgi:hypothetical protein